MQVVAEDSVVERAREGDPAAFQTLVERHSGDVFRLAFRMTRHEEDAEDVVQETFIRAYKRLEHFEGRANFKTWLYRVTANTAIDLLRRRKRAESRSEPLDHVEPGVSAGQERALFGSQVRDHIELALTGLTDLERAAFVLRHCEDLSLKEISATLDITLNATKQAIFRAVRKLRTTLAAVPRSAT